MASLLGNTSSSSLLKSASSLATAVSNYQDQVQALNYANSAYTDEAYSAYSDYLNGRISTLNSAGGIVNASKALTLVKTLESATHSNVSASITRENINVLAGNATPTDKYNVIVGQYTRAMNNGDLTLAQSLENQAYSLSQTIQQQAQQAADASASLAKAESTQNITYQGQVVTNLQEALKSFNATAKHGSERELNSDLAAWANDPNTKSSLTALGVKISGSQPSYWDVASGIAGAIYNHKVLQAQAESASNPLVARTYASEAQDILTGGSKFQTLGGSLTALEIQQAQQDPNMFSFDNTKGTFTRNVQNGYQYMTFTDENGQQSKQLVPQYSDYASTQKAAYNKVYFLTPQETTAMTKLGLNFSENKNGTTGNGVGVQISQNSPEWLKGLLGDGGTSNFFTDQNGFLTFEAGSTKDQGPSYYTLATDDRGLSGVFEHSADGGVTNVGGDYGFNAGAVQLLVNKGEQVQQQIVVAQQKAAQALKVQQAQAQQQLEAQQAQSQATAAQGSAQRTSSPQGPTVNPQQTVSPAPPTLNPQGGNYNPQQGGTNAGTLHVTQGRGIAL